MTVGVAEHTAMEEGLLGPELLHGASTLADQPWWTPADQAELDVLTLELVDGVTWHTDNCPHAWTNRFGNRECDCRSIGEAIRVVIDWQHRRILHSRAQWLRRLQDRRDAA